MYTPARGELLHFAPGFSWGGRGLSLVLGRALFAFLQGKGCHLGLHIPLQKALFLVLGKGFLR